MELSKRFIVSTLLIATFYLLFTTYLRNLSLVNSTLVSGFPLIYKIKLFTALLQGMTTTKTSFALSLMVITGLLTGANISLVAQRVTQLRKAGRVHIAAGGSSLLGIVGGGCASCGLPILSLLGLSGSVLYLPFKGAELPYISIGLLVTSLFFLVRTDKKAAKSCKIIDNKKQLPEIKRLAKVYRTVKEYV